MIFLDRLRTPDGHELTLHQRDGDFFINIDGEQLMSTRRSGSESALAQLACAGLEKAEKPRVLIGGLGLGYTLRATLETLPKRAEVVVAELFPEVVAWNRGHLAHLQSEALDDTRTEIAVGDVWDILGQRGPWHAVMLDVDNGPGKAANCMARNRRLYVRSGFERLRRSLVPGGQLGVWSADPDPTYVRQLQRFGFTVRTERPPEHGSKGKRHTIFLARWPETRDRRRGRAQ